MSVFLVMLGAVVGAPLRYLAGRYIAAHGGSGFPWDTLAVNIAASAMLGVLTGGFAVHAIPESAVTVGGVGLCGALSTYSTFAQETVTMARGGDWLHAVFNVVTNAFCGLGAALLGFAIAAGVWAG